MATMPISTRHFEAEWPRSSQAPLRSGDLSPLDEEASPVRSRRRRIAANVLGWTTIAAVGAFAVWMVAATAARDVIAFWGTVGNAGEMVPRRVASLQIAAAMATPDAVAPPTPSSALPAVATESSTPAPQPSVAAELSVAPGAAPAPPVPALKALKPAVAAPARPRPRTEAANDPYVAAPAPAADPYEN